MSLAVWDWRRRVAALYAEVRATAEPHRAHARWREGRGALFATHPASPIPPAERGEFRGLRYGEYDPAYRFECEVEESDAAAWSTETGTDGVVGFACLGAVALGELGRLEVWWHEGYGGGIFLPLADPNPDTYGGGRYVLDTIKGADLGGSHSPDGPSRLVVDLNFAYNPSCAYDPAWACPLAPAGNRLVAAIPVGELAPR